MKKSKERLAALILAAVMLLSTAGCGRQNTASTAAPGQTEASGENEESTAASAEVSSEAASTEASGESAASTAASAEATAASEKATEGGTETSAAPTEGGTKATEKATEEATTEAATEATTEAVTEAPTAPAPQPAWDPKGLSNLALRAEVTATYEPYGSSVLAENLIDGNHAASVNTSCRYHWDRNGYFLFELDAAYEISGYHIYNYEWPYQWCINKSWTVLGSLDGQSWTELAKDGIDCSPFTEPVQYATKLRGGEADGGAFTAPMKARYVKLVIDEVFVGDGDNTKGPGEGANGGMMADIRMYEFEIYGDAGSAGADLPEPPQRQMNALREKAVAYMKAMAAVEWKPASTFTVVREFTAGKTYRGLPYTNVMDSCLEEFVSCLEGGVYTGPTDKDHAVGVDCTSSTLAAWNTVITDCSAVWSKYMVPGRGQGTVPVGAYRLPQTASTTDVIIQMNGKQTMYRAYAQTIPGDAVLTYTTAGHCRMVTGYPEVVYFSDGTIDGAHSYVTVTEIVSVPSSANGVMSTWKVDYRYTFIQLYNTAYVPLSTAQLDAGVPSPVSFSFSDPFTAADLVNNGLPGRLSSNYRIFEVTAEVKDAAGKTVRSVTKYPLNNPDNCLVMSSKSFTLSELNAELDLTALPAGSYTLSISAKANGSVSQLKTVSFDR